ncbi:MAG: hypothetical protein LBG19_04130 [Prevotellaceae bacterium]|jgi:lipid II:glycine glycyltransferase (peptidoglycan interpeptide bridge formation enzyme)|nr:hypothetical protein [Prevotellaceae bacterium]
MFKNLKKKAEEENKIVDYIIQIYAEQSIIDGRLLDFIDEKAHTEGEKRELLASLDRYNTLLHEHPMFDKLKKQLFGADKNLLILTHIELSVCFLANTKKYYPEAIIDMLWIDKERFEKVVQSLETKLCKGGYRLPSGYKAMQPFIHEYFTKY